MDLTRTTVISDWLRQQLIPDCQIPFNESDVAYMSGDAAMSGTGPISVVTNSSITVVRFGAAVGTSAASEDYFYNNNNEEHNPSIMGSMGDHIANGSLMHDVSEWSPTSSNDLQVLLILIAYTISFVLSFGGNILAIIVFIRFDYWPKDLRLLLTNISVASLTSAVLCLPFTLLYQLLQSWVFTGPLCRIITFLQLASTIGTILTHLAIGLNRLWVIVYPLKAHTFQEYVWRVVGVVWFVSACISSPNLVTTDTRPRRSNEGCYSGKRYLMCMEGWDPEYSAAYTWALMLCMYFLPMIVLLCIYGIAGYVLTKSEEIILNERTMAKRVEVKRKVLRMLMLIFALFALSWMPLHTFFIFQTFHEELIMANFEMAERFYWVIHWLATSNSFQNPIVYAFLDDKFKTGVVNLVSSKKTVPGRACAAIAKPAAGVARFTAASRSTQQVSSAYNRTTTTTVTASRRDSSSSCDKRHQSTNGRHHNDDDDSDCTKALLLSRSKETPPKLDDISLSMVKTVNNSEQTTRQNTSSSLNDVAKSRSPESPNFSECSRPLVEATSTSGGTANNIATNASGTSSPTSSSVVTNTPDTNFYVLYEYTVL